MATFKPGPILNVAGWNTYVQAGQSDELYDDDKGYSHHMAISC